MSAITSVTICVLAAVGVVLWAGVLWAGEAWIRQDDRRRALARERAYPRLTLPPSETRRTITTPTGLPIAGTFPRFPARLCQQLARQAGAEGAALVRARTPRQDVLWIPGTTDRQIVDLLVQAPDPHRR